MSFILTVVPRSCCSVGPAHRSSHHRYIYGSPSLRAGRHEQSLVKTEESSWSIQNNTQSSPVCRSRRRWRCSWEACAWRFSSRRWRRLSMRSTASEVSPRRTSSRWTPRTDTRWSSTGSRNGQRASSSWSSACGSTGCCGTARRSAAATAARWAGTTTPCSPTAACASCATSSWELRAWRSARPGSQCLTSRIHEGIHWKLSTRGFRIGTYSTRTTRWDVWRVVPKTGAPSKRRPRHWNHSPESLCTRMKFLLYIQVGFSSYKLFWVWQRIGKKCECAFSVSASVRKGHMNSHFVWTTERNVSSGRPVESKATAALLRPPADRAVVEHVPRLCQCSPETIPLFFSIRRTGTSTSCAYEANAQILFGRKVGFGQTPGY